MARAMRQKPYSVMLNSVEEVESANRIYIFENINCNSMVFKLSLAILPALNTLGAAVGEALWKPFFFFFSLATVGLFLVFL